MQLGKPYFVTGLTLLVLACGLALAAQFGDGRTSTEVEKNLYTVQPGYSEIAIVTLPFVLAASTFLAGLGGIQEQIKIAQTIQGSALWAAGAGVVFLGMMPWWAGRSSPFDPTGLTEAQWLGFVGSVLFFYALMVNFIGNMRYFAELRRGGARTSFPGGKPMLAAKVYACGGLLVVLLVVLRVGLDLSPWRDWVSGLSTVMARLFVYPIATALGAASLLLSVMQPTLQIPGWARTAGAFLYFIGAGLCLVFLPEDLRRDSRWETMSWPTAAGLALLLVALSINLIGALRSGENALPAPRSQE